MQFDDQKIKLTSKSFKQKFLASAALGLAVAYAPTFAVAQSEDAASESGKDVIVVTARNREENLQDVPLAVTAFDAAAIAQRSIQELDDVARFTAGFAFEDFDGGNSNPVVRGQSTLIATAREQTVATFLDGVYMPRSWLVDLGTANVERIEIVKGPQSARYGRNAFSGAINYISRQAEDELAADLTTTLGNHERFDIGGSVNLPLIEDVLSVRGSGWTTEFDGSWVNDHPNAALGVNPEGTKDKVGGWDNQTYTAAITFTPMERLSIQGNYYRFKKSEEARATNWLNTRDGSGNCGALQPIDGGGTGGSIYCGEYPVATETVTMDPRGFGRNASADIFRAAIDFEITEAVNFNYLFGHVDADTVTANTAESDTVACATIITSLGTCNFQGSPIGNVNYDQHEVRVTYDDGGRLSGGVGVFFLDGFDSSQSISINVPAGDPTPLNVDPTFAGGLDNFIFRNQETDTDVLAIFAEFTYSFTEQLRLGFEGRYTKEEIETIDLRPDPDELVGSETFEFFTPRVTLEYDLSEDNLLFATAARGAKAGGFNSNAITTELEVYDPEFNWTYEVGSKNTLLDGRAVVNASAFLTKWKNQQINRLDPLGSPFTGAVTANLGNATVLGFEIETAVDVTENFSVDGAFSYTKATYDDGTIDEQFTVGDGAFPPPCDDIACSSTGDVSGNDLQRAPRTQVAFGAMWEDELTANLDYYIRGDMGYQSSFFASQINAAEMPSRTVINASAGIKHENVELRFWARNLADKKYVSNSLQIIQPFSNNILGTYYGERRTYGATLSVSY